MTRPEASVAGENPSAFPNTGNSNWGMEPTAGMSLRDWFAGQALPAALKIGEADPRLTEHNFERIVALMSYGIADAMLSARKDGGK